MRRIIRRVRSRPCSNRGRLSRSVLPEPLSSRPHSSHTRLAATAGSADAVHARPRRLRVALHGFDAGCERTRRPRARRARRRRFPGQLLAPRAGRVQSRGRAAASHDLSAGAKGFRATSRRSIRTARWRMGHRDDSVSAAVADAAEPQRSRTRLGGGAEGESARRRPPSASGFSSRRRRLSFQIPSRPTIGRAFAAGRRRCETVYALFRRTPRCGVSMRSRFSPPPRRYALRRTCRSRRGDSACASTRKNPDHPGAMHYLVHANDMPGREHESLEITHKYEQLAPNNPHALHMPTHIYTRLGDWDGVIRGNLRAAEAALQYPAGDTANTCGTSFRTRSSISMYAYSADRRRRRRAAQTEAAARGAEPGTEFKTAFHLASTQARYALERRAWTEAVALVPREPAIARLGSLHVARSDHVVRARRSVRRSWASSPMRMQRANGSASSNLPRASRRGTVRAQHPHARARAGGRAVGRAG